MHLTQMQSSLPRVLGLGQAILVGLGSILGTGVFVSLALSAGIAGIWILPALLVAFLLALCNGLSSASLASAHPVSGGTYEYGYRFLHPLAGFIAGWTFLLAKTASAATAALGAAGYLLELFGLAEQWRVPLAMLLVAGMTLLVLGGMQRSAAANSVIVSFTLLALCSFIVAGLAQGTNSVSVELSPLWAGVGFSWGRVLQASALLFVAYTGYARIATLGEEVREPYRTIPRAVMLSLAIAGVLYLGVAAAAISAVGLHGFTAAAQRGLATLSDIATTLDVPMLPELLGIGAVTAMLGVLLNLLLGLSRTMLSMARRGDMPLALGAVNAAGTPAPAIIVVGSIVLALAAVGSVKLAWSFSAFNVLIYYAITNAAALRLLPAASPGRTLTAWIGLLACLGLAFFVETRVWLAGLGLMCLGLVWYWLRGPARLRAIPWAN
jgi:APA family basic amino acid/polyamine antiporter